MLLWEVFIGCGPTVGHKSPETESQALQVSCSPRESRKVLRELLGVHAYGREASSLQPSRDWLAPSVQVQVPFPGVLGSQPIPPSSLPAQVWLVGT